MEGSLLDRGIGWYYNYEELQEDDDFDMLESNPGNWIGLGLASAYVIWPIDLIPDMIPFIGYMDDLAVMRFGWSTGGIVYDFLSYL